MPFRTRLAQLIPKTIIPCQIAPLLLQQHRKHQESSFPLVRSPEAHKSSERLRIPLKEEYRPLMNLKARHLFNVIIVLCNGFISYMQVFIDLFEICYLTV